MFFARIRWFSTKLPQSFDPLKSKYSGLRETQNLSKMAEMRDAPAYLKDE